MDHNRNSRTSSWDSKMSVSTVSSATRNYRRSASSILSCDSDIRFTRKKLSSQYKCGCCIIACFLLLLLLAGASVYVGYTFLAPLQPEEQVYLANFKVISGDVYTSELANPTTENFKTKSRDYRERLNLLFRRSSIRHGFVGTEVLALDGNEAKDLVVHFNIHIDPSYVHIDAKNLKRLLLKEISRTESEFFRNLTIDSSSLEVKESTTLPQIMTTVTTRIITEAVTQTTVAPRTCSPLQLPYCSKLPYNVTTYPNLLGHKNVKDVEEDIIAFRELVDAECYRLAYEFVCQVVQPSCKLGEEEDKIILPCRSFCRDFMSGCGSRLLAKFKELLDCSRFPEFGDTPTCTAKPDCVQEMQARALSPRICDGVADCQDISDEKSCTYCPIDQIHCGIGRVCIPITKRCDGIVDCPDGSDERACLSLAPSVVNITSAEIVTPHLSRYYSEGFVVFNEKGEVGKLCADNLNESLSENNTIEVLHTVATSLCQSLTFQKVLSVQIEKDEENNISYVIMKNPTAPEINFIRSKCKTKKVLKISCSEPECGLQSNHRTVGIEGLPKIASHGNWPWHAALFKEDVHVCDATLVSPEWLVTTASCFQGQPKAEWTARFGTIRLYSSSPWQQERRIVGMVKSPVEGSTIAMVKLEDPVALSDFVRPICLPEDNPSMVLSNVTQCNTLGWGRNREQLQRVQVNIAEMEKCENISISTVNSLCTEAPYGENDCNEEEFAGTPMLCLHPDGVRWSLVGVTNWRIACLKSGVDRPRMYDKITSNVKWIHDTISAIT